MLSDIRALSGLDEISRKAEEEGISIAKLSIVDGCQYHKKPDSWPEVDCVDNDAELVSIDLMNASNRQDLATRLSKSASKVRQFPADTIFLHTLGCIAAAMSKSFRFDYWGDESPVNMYVITAQPPSTGKSGINRITAGPIMDWYIKRNEETQADRVKIQSEIKKLEKDSNVEHHEFVDRMNRLDEDLKQYREWQLPITDATIEACESSAAKQDGLFSIISAEADAVNVIVGASYGDSAKKSNQGLLLSGWDGEFVRSVRVTRDGFSGYATGSIAIIAQNDGIDSILEAGANGRGLAERFFLLKEQDMLGVRNFDAVTADDRQSLSLVRDEYSRFIKRVMDEDDVLLTFDKESNQLVKACCAFVENEIGESGRYSNNLMTGLVGKMDKHIRKLACILHCVDEWGSGGDRSTVVKVEHVGYAHNLFKELIKTFECSSDQLGFIGERAEQEKIKERLISYAEKGKLSVDTNSLRGSIKNVKPFKTSRNITSSMKMALSKLEQLGYCIVDKNTIHINPRLK